MRISSILWLVVSVALAGCGRETAAPAKASPKANAVNMPSISAGQAHPTQTAPPPPTGSAGVTPQVAAPEATPTDGTVDAPTGLSEVERLNWALEMYHVAHLESPPLTSFDPLIKAKLIKEVPKAPAGKKYVLNGPAWEVRLENSK